MIDPAYGTGSLADLLPSVLTSLGVAGEASPLELAPTGRVVVLLVDGLGLELLARHADAAPFLSSLAPRPLTTGFPSTTVTSLSSFGTGLPPGEHGLTGFTSWVQEVEQVVGWLSWRPAGGGGDLRGALVPSAAGKCSGHTGHGGEGKAAPTGGGCIASHALFIEVSGPAFSPGPSRTRSFRAV